MKAYTDYPFIELGDTSGKEAPVRECVILSYDGDKYCTVLVEGIHGEVKSGYLYTKYGRYGEVPNVGSKLEELLQEN